VERLTSLSIVPVKNNLANFLNCGNIIDNVASLKASRFFFLKRFEKLVTILLLYVTMQLCKLVANRVARCPVLHRTVRYFGSLFGIKMKVIPEMHVSGIFNLLVFSILLTICSKMIL